MRARRVLLSVLLLAATAAAGRAQDGDAPPPEHDMSRKHAGDAPQHTNRLAAESSPYLLQHAHNPVDWYPWGDEAFAKAREEDKPVFLSIGYSTCHWCHVMERESFENEDIAAVLNEHFVCIKVDREERPDVDAIYMSAVQAMSGRGGWPLSVWLTHDRKPFLGGTYFPPGDRYGRPGFRTVLARIAELWETRRDELLQQAETLVDHVRSQSGAKGGGELTLDTLETCVRQHAGAFDAQHGGFGPAPKFPHAFSVSLLLRQAGRGSADQILPMLRGTLDAMLEGGLHDHLGGGFHRYSTDREWLLPHFEKMLYDQASLGRAYVEAYQVTGEERYAEVAHGIFGYVLRDLRDPGGGFHSAEDADSEGEEGKFYVWTPAEIAAVLGDEDAALVCDVYEVRPEGNFRDEATHEPSGTNILHLRETLRTHAQRRGVDLPAFRERLAELRDRLLAARARRVRPHLDDKVLTDWNGLMIGALALGGTALREPRYVEAAREAAEFLVATMRTDGGLLHRYRDGRAGIDGFLTDHAFLADGLVELHQATQDPRWLAVARDLVKEMVARFRRADGTFVLAAGRGDELVAETVELYDGDRPSGNSAAVLALLRVGRLTGDEELARLGRESLAAWSGTIERYSMGYTYALRALDLELGPTREIVIAGDPASPATQALLAAARDRFVARDVVLVHPPGDAGAAVRELSPFVARQLPVDGLPAAYVCTNHTCAAPVTDPDALRAALRGAD